MTANFPTSLDVFTTPSGTSTLGGSTPNHTTLHTNTGDAVEALEAKVGVDGSAVTTSLDYKVANRVQVAGDIGGTAASPQVIATHLSAALPIAQGGTGSTSQNFVSLAGDLGGTVTVPTVTATHLSSALPVNQGGTGSTTQNFVDLTTTQSSIGGNKTFTGNVVVSTGIGADLYVTKASSTSRNTTTTVTSDPNLTLTVAANATYVVDCTVVWTNGGGGFRCAWTGPAGATMVWTDNDGAGNGTISTQSTFSATVGTTLKGALVTSGTSGTFALQWAQNTSNAANTTLLAGCYLWLRRVA